MSRRHVFHFSWLRECFPILRIVKPDSEPHGAVSMGGGAGQARVSPHLLPIKKSNTKVRTAVSKQPYLLLPSATHYLLLYFNSKMTFQKAFQDW